MCSSQIDPTEVVAALREAVGARAAGLWRLEPTRLVLLAFVPAADLDPVVARGFADATRAIGLDRVDLGVVHAAGSGVTAVSVAADLPPAAGSGHWLRAFGADCSIAVPLKEGDRVRGVLSVALPAPAPGREATEAVVREHAARLGPLDRFVPAGF